VYDEDEGESDEAVPEEDNNIALRNYPTSNGHQADASGDGSSSSVQGYGSPASPHNSGYGQPASAPFAEEADPRANEEIPF
jgi:hypothetical protein